MIRTEKEARQTRCCGTEGCGERRDNGKDLSAVGYFGTTNRYCIGSACMAWWWYRPNHVDQLVLEMEAQRLQGTPHEFDPEERRGYCGLAPWAPP